eukprot:g282.t1
MLAIRPMTPADVPAALAVRLATRENAVTLDELRDDYGVTPEAMAEALSAGSVAGWVAETTGQVVGFAMGARRSGEVLVVAVHPDHEGEGAGKRLLAAVVDWLSAHGCDPIWLKANPDPTIRATGFYRRLGWRPTGERRGADVVLTLGRGDTGE